MLLIKKATCSFTIGACLLNPLFYFRWYSLSFYTNIKELGAGVFTTTGLMKVLFA